MALLELRNVRLAFGAPTLLDGVDLRLEPAERVCLIGRNGTGKTCLLEILAGVRAPDSGERVLPRGARVALLPQDVPADLAGPVRLVVAAGAGLDEPWRTDLEVERVLAEVELDGDLAVETLSVGQKRRALLARALARRPDLLLLDEPTNHLDLPTIAWLESYLARWSGTLFFVTHDRSFLRRFARRIVELDRGRLVDWTCDYDTWVRRKEALLAEEESREREFDRRLAVEEAWLRKGIRARRTRNEGRVRRLEALRRERDERRGREGEVRLQANDAERSGRLVAAARGLQLVRGGRELFADLDLTVLRGDRIGIIGPNGAGKTSLLKVLLGELAPTRGELRRGANVQPAYFDQLREVLDPDRSVRWNVSEGLDTLTVAGRPRHVIGYLEDFLFTPERAAQPVRSLSGGERNRLLLARLFTRPANVLVLDEPTNDLDLETLELLENLLAEYTGTVLVVSHDRQFLDEVVTSTLAFDGRGRVREYVGGYADWERQSGGWPAAQAVKARPGRPEPGGGAVPVAPATRRRKLKWKEERELEGLPGRIETLEREQRALHARLADPGLYRNGGEGIAAVQSRLQVLASELASLYTRWEDLETIAGSD
ncbi:MAG TPA: ATP-binding cassette domain-containing protein [Candidatus Krumholzibacteria bacterium]|nr:ATP-binding cassette domain-containing protein [Candidatus Krumholzibacteria bacterium]HPD72573.1 ATP-binding cassette domain-containing protein [Candidatus Krumholzibacteria bacterium]HRY40495.1 ATP-binding cassette domain-containing protein [Candidatus Krumholzibacteria bacterium]